MPAGPALRLSKSVTVDTITRRITVGKDEVTIDLHYIPKASPQGSLAAVTAERLAVRKI
jgi:hypothetical protein